MSAQRPDTQDYLSLFLNDTPLMDVRAPVEFSKGSFPTARNCYLLDDEQRRQVGIRFKQKGQAEAIALGNELARPAIREQRMAMWRAFVEQHPEGYLFCYRGGLRSHITQAWLKEVGINYPLITGGYKAMRAFLLRELDKSVAETTIVVLSGRTGTGKTRLLVDLPVYVDLEGIANHRGSSFGKRIGGQPAQISFENQLSIDLLKRRHAGEAPVVLEDESRLIGRNALPQELRDRMGEAPIMLLDEAIEVRVQMMLEDYIDANLADFQQAHGEEQGFELFAEGLRTSLNNIQKRLGGERHQKLAAEMDAAIDTLARSGSNQGFCGLVEALLVNYYDPMYDYQLSKKEGEILIKGNRQELLEWSRSYWNA